MIDSGAMWAALVKRYPSPQYALLAQVSNGTGFTGNRYADAIAMSLWPSRGLHLYGFEIKVRRNDWLRELKNPAKAEEIAAFCTYWWIVAPKDVVRLEEMPEAWGLLVLEGRRLVAHKNAAMRAADPPDLPMLAAILRRATETTTPKKSVAAQLVAARQEGIEVGRQRADRETGLAHVQAKLDELAETVRKFETAAGIDIGSVWSAGDVGKRFARTLVLDELKQGGDLKMAEERLAHALEAVRAARSEPEGT